MPIKDPESLKKYRKQYYQKHREELIKKTALRKKEISSWFSNYKKQCVCSICGESNPITLDFHHLDPSLKKDSVSDMVVNGYGIETIKKEIDKCVVLCTNHHRLYHYEQDIYSKT